jgi:hypothetical protein
LNLRLYNIKLDMGPQTQAAKEQAAKEKKEADRKDSRQ